MPEFKYVRNSKALLLHGHEDLRRDAIAILDHVLDEVSPYKACRRRFKLLGDTLIVGETQLSVPPNGKIWFFGVGKASLGIARAVEEVLAERLCGGLVICKEGQTGQLARIDIMHASHPVPSEASIAAAEEMVRRVALPQAGDIVIFGITGGSSALMSLPCGELPLRDIQRLTEILLTCGADIFEINAVRKHLSKVGGGRLALLLNPDVLMVNLTVSDVIGDALDYITDPTVPDTSSIADARATFDKFDLWSRVPDSIGRFLSVNGGVTETPKELRTPKRHDALLLSSASVCEAARAKAEAIGYSAMILSSCFEGESQALGQSFAAIAQEILHRGQPLRPPCAVIGGGETVVRMEAFSGSGGPNQEFALNGARYLPHRRAVLLGADTDGTDGPTEIAGAVCDGATVERARAQRLDLFAALRQHDVTPMLMQLEDAIITGATGTNVNDLKLLLVR